MRKLLASDLDGTLIFENKISNENKEAIHRLKDKDGVFAISTGRPLNGVEKVIDALEIHPDYLILNNGALILDGHKEIVYSEFIDYSVVKEIVEKLSSEKWVIAVETGFATYPLGEKADYEERGFLSDIDATFNNVHFIHSLEEISEKEREGLTLISLYYPRATMEEVVKVCDGINHTYGKYVSAYRNTTFIDIVPKGCSKGSGVEHVSDIAKIDMDDVYTIGDSWNDDSMFEVTKNSFTFVHAEEELQKKTTYVVKTVAECIDEYILK